VAAFAGELQVIRRRAVVAEHHAVEAFVVLEGGDHLEADTVAIEADCCREVVR
jgi:hypothetical protein